MHKRIDLIRKELVLTGSGKILSTLDTSGILLILCLRIILYLGQYILILLTK